MTDYDPILDGDKLIDAKTLFVVLTTLAEGMRSPRSEIVAALGYTPADASLLGEEEGIATLDANGKLPASQMPSQGVYIGDSSSTPDDSAAIWIVS